jgi:zinc/manganese transport system substrate-binding protein
MRTVLTLLLLSTTLAHAAPLQAVAAESQYADIITQIGGPYVTITSIEADPNTDPHSFEISPAIAAKLATADLVIENGLGYDGWADKLLAATQTPTRKTINVQHLLNLPDSTPNPHLWYDPKTMPAVANAITTDLSALDPAHATYYQAQERKFIASLVPETEAVQKFKAKFAGSRIAVTEPVGNYLLESLGLTIVTPFSLQAAIMNGTDPAPQDISLQNALLASHTAKIFVYNQQVTDPLTDSFLTMAKQNHIPVVGVYETMPAPGYTYQSWMLAEINALTAALETQKSTETLLK